MVENQKAAAGINLVQEEHYEIVNAVAKIVYP